MTEDVEPVCESCRAYYADGECHECSILLCEDCGLEHGCDASDLEDGDPGEP